MSEGWLGLPGAAIKSCIRSLRMRSYKKKLAASQDSMDKLELEVIEILQGKPYMGGAYEYIEFKKKYYDLLPHNQKENVRKILLKILQTEIDFSAHIHGSAAYVCSDLELYEAEPIIRRLLADPRYEEQQRDLRIALEFFEIRLPKEMKFIFTRRFSKKTQEEYDRSIELYSNLPSEEQIKVLQALLELIRGQDIMLSLISIVIYLRIKPDEAKIEIERMKADPMHKENIGFLKSLQEKYGIK